MTDEQKERYQALQGEFVTEAGSLLQENEKVKREQETVTAQMKQKAEQIASHMNEMDNTRVGVDGMEREGIRNWIMSRNW